jgi:hypothetical protein
MKTNNLHHLNAQIVQAATVINIQNIVDFCDYLEHHNTREIFKLTDPNRFAILNNHGLFQILSKDFLCVEDYKKATQAHFEKSEDYYAATDQGIKSYEEYEMIVKHGITDKSIVEEVKNQGYIDGFENFKRPVFAHKTVPKFKNALEFYNYGVENGYENYPACMVGIMAGFTNAAEFNAAFEKGFTLAVDYNEAIENGFLNSDEYEKAKAENVKTRHEWIQKTNLEVSYPDLPHDQSLLLLLLSKLEQGKKASINKLKQLLETEIKEFLSADDKPFGWLNISLKTNDDFTDFLQNNENVSKFGKYDVDGEFFELYKIQNRSIVIDGSNIAHNSKNGIPEKPSVANMILMVNHLKSKGFTDIMIISDASLRHKLSDVKRLPELDKIAKHDIAPAGTQADVFLISYVKSKHCLLLSNDAFNQYKLTDPWVAVNIDFYRLTFMITDGEVFMPDLE